MKIFIHIHFPRLICIMFLFTVSSILPSVYFLRPWIWKCCIYEKVLKKADLKILTNLHAVSVCMCVSLAHIWKRGWILFTSDIKIIYHRSVPSEYDHCSSKNSSLSNAHQNTMMIFSKTSLMVLVISQYFMQTA